MLYLKKLDDNAERKQKLAFKLLYYLTRYILFTTSPTKILFISPGVKEMARYFY